MVNLRNRVYIAGPYSAKGTEERLQNTFAAIKAGERLRAHGYVPFVPHLYHWWDEFSTHDYQYWMDLDQMWLESCDILCRIGKISPGGDIEVGWAQQLRMPVYKGVDDLLTNLGACSNPRAHRLT